MRKELCIVQGAEVEAALRRAVRNALLTHKRAGNAIATWDGEKVVIVPADEIVIDDASDVERRGQQET
ncbi:MAG TPA: hypothetical protein VM866_01690 [Pyrinomonadaceae bacterium]|nr:hypothetical protein [Pyrinomonadaceae bacterium]